MSDNRQQLLLSLRFQVGWQVLCQLCPADFLSCRQRERLAADRGWRAAAHLLQQKTAVCGADAADPTSRPGHTGAAATVAGRSSLACITCQQALAATINSTWHRWNFAVLEKTPSLAVPSLLLLEAQIRGEAAIHGGLNNREFISDRQFCRHGRKVSAQQLTVVTLNTSSILNRNVS